MYITRIDHINITVETNEIDAVRDFYVNALALLVGPRPPFSFPGYWMYANERPLVHIAGKSGASMASTTGKLNHVALACDNFQELTKRLARHGITYRTREVPFEPVRQIFVSDPAGVLLELNFPIDRP